jgi:hypothetical protein
MKNAILQMGFCSYSTSIPMATRMLLETESGTGAGSQGATDSRLDTKLPEAPVSLSAGDEVPKRDIPPESQTDTGENRRAIAENADKAIAAAERAIADSAEPKAPKTRQPRADKGIPRKKRQGSAAEVVTDSQGNQIPVGDIKKQTIATMSYVLFDLLLAKGLGEHWKLTKEERETLGITAIPVLDKHWPTWWQDSPEVVLVFTVAGIVMPRVQTTLKIAKEKKQAKLTEKRNESEPQRTQESPTE